jgi:hypothetical protein
LTLFGVLCLMLSVSLDSSVIVLAFCVVTSVLFVFVLYLIPNVDFVSELYLSVFLKVYIYDLIVL